VGDVIMRHSVRSAPGESSRTLRFYYDTGSPETFIKRSATKNMRNVSPLAVPEPFGGLGDGAFEATHLVLLEVNLMRFWCRHVAYVVNDTVLESFYDVLAGHDFMQRFNIVPRPRRKDVKLDAIAIQLSQKLKSRIRSRSSR
jgi:hypothetical protein